MTHEKNMIKLFEKLRYQHDMFTVFSDFLEMSAISISNVVDLFHYKKREQRYLDIVKKYNRNELDIFSQILAELVLSLEEKPSDILGSVYMKLEIFNSWKGQFFTPMPVSDLMGAFVIDEQKIKEKGYLTLNEPACGGGATVIGLINGLQAKGYNYQKVLRVVAQDIDIKSVHMCYLQLSLLGIDAEVMRGDTLSLKFDSDVWKTPNHVLKWGRTSNKPPEPVKKESNTNFVQLSLFEAI